MPRLRVRDSHQLAIELTAKNPDMDSHKLIRKALLLTALFNLGAALAFAFPQSIGQIVSLPVAPPVYTALTAAFIALFGGSYAWLALQASISGPLLMLGAIGKTAAFAIFLTLWLCGQVSLLLMLGGIGDLAFAMLFFAYLRSSADSARR